MSASPKSKQSKKSTPILIVLLRKSSQHKTVLVVIFIILFAGIGTIMLRSSFAYAGWHPWNDPQNRNTLVTHGSYIDFGQICGKSGTSYFLFGPYDTIDTGPSGMDITMGVYAQGIPGELWKYRIDMTANNGTKPLASLDSSVHADGYVDYIATGAHLAANTRYSGVEYRIASLQGTVCVSGYYVWTK